MRIAICIFPGTTCERDCLHVFNNVLGQTVIPVSSEVLQLPAVDAVVLPGGFAFGDYLRPGAIARFAPLMADVARFVAAGHPVLGICNGFQILCEAGLLPGALTRNVGGRFICRDTTLTVATTRCVLTRTLEPGLRLRIPMAHADGRYVVDQATLADLRRHEQVVLRYASENPNGSTDAIAAVCNRDGNCVGLMPHPERAAEAVLGGTDGARLLMSFVGIEVRW